MTRPAFSGPVPRGLARLPVTLTDGTSFQFFMPLDLVRDRVRGGTFAVDDLGRVFEFHELRDSPKRRWNEWRARKAFEKRIPAKRVK